jgi:putative spermidine/putrescine transport system substrate-binding protein
VSEKREANPARVAWLIVAGLVAALVGIGCGGGGGDNNDQALQKIGKGEGALSLVNWAGYVEDGTDYKGVDWVTPFEKQTGCQVSYKEAGTSDEMVQLMRTGQYDGISASGNASGRLVAGGDVAPVNVDLVPNYKDIIPALKDQPYNTFDGTHYGIPHGRGANLLMWRTDFVKPDPTSWDVVLDPNKASKYKGTISAYDDPIYIADAAVYLKAHDPSLGIDNPYELDDKQFNAAVDLLKQQRPNIGEYWNNATKQIQSFTNGDDHVGTTWQYQYFVLKADGQPVASIPASQGFVPEEGATGWSDTWMISSEAKHPNCMYEWFNYVTSPKVQAQIVEFFGEAPANVKACGLTTDPKFCDDYHATDEKFWDRVYYWNVPVADCGDDRGDACKDYNEWTAAWTSIKG